ncbi:MAG: DUF3822 family protein [Bacteroidales bacterium]|nr:DUF3822 family protein [Bacteroidales bacterium]MCB8999858.1 DUF3822 family protein [Bacteroidales bacterium]
MEYLYIREDFDIHSISEKILSIQISLDGFSFIINPFNKKEKSDYIFIRRIDLNDPDSLPEALDSFKQFDQKEFYAIRIIFHEKTFTLVPDSLFDLSDMKAYINLNHPSLSRKKNISSRIIQAEAVCIFSVEQDLYDLLRKKFPGADYCHSSLPLITFALNQKTDGCFVQCYERSLEIASIKNGGLFMYNIFELQDINDIVYFILNSFKSAELDPQFNPLLIAGVLPEKSEAIAVARKYIKDIRFYSSNYSLTVGKGELQYPLSYYLNHREILNCEL